MREAIFSRLEHLGVVDDAHVLDLYAGSGALGLEAASRGAADVTLVDSARVAADVARRNVAALGLSNVHVVAQPAEAFVAGVAAAAAQRSAAGDAAGAAGAAGASSPGRAGHGPFHLVLVDPPYDVTAEALERVLAHLAVPGVLDPAAVVVVERSTRTPEPTWPAGWELVAHKDYGETAVFFVGPELPDDT